MITFDIFAMKAKIIIMEWQILMLRKKVFFLYLKKYFQIIIQLINLKIVIIGQNYRFRNANQIN